ncbi:MAG: hypothetical protein U0894_19100 [Pirellulales bacterium]
MDQELSMMKWFGDWTFAGGDGLQFGYCGRTEATIKALLITGGCCHDYSKQKFIFAWGISARANVADNRATRGKHNNGQNSYYENDDWAKGYDIVVHNESVCRCCSPQSGRSRVLRPHRAGTPAVVIHCEHTAIATRRMIGQVLGVTSDTRTNYPFEVQNARTTRSWRSLATSG